MEKNLRARPATLKNANSQAPTGTFSIEVNLSNDTSCQVKLNQKLFTTNPLLLLDKVRNDSVFL